MTMAHPSWRILKKCKTFYSAANTAKESTITVPSTRFGVIYKLWVALDSATETDVENGAASMGIDITIGSTEWHVIVHPFIAHVDTQTVVAEHRWVDLGPWLYDFGPDGLYSGVRGDNIVVGLGAAGTGIVARANYLYSGD